MDVKITFLNVIIEDEVYIEQPYGFEVHDRETYVCSFNKSLYGLKQVPKAWYSRSDSNMQNIGFTKSEVDPNLYLLIPSKPHILVLYVDDLIRIGVERLIACCISDIALEFEMRDNRSMHHFLGICSKQVRSSLGRGSTN